MESANLLIIFFALLIGAVIFVVSIQRKEAKKSEQLHLTAKYKYRANETANILSNFSKIPIGEETRKILLQVIQRNLSLALKVQPDDQYVRERLPIVNKQLANISTKIDSNQLVIPAEPKQLENLLNRLKKLSSYIIKTSQSNKLDLALTKSSIAKISSLITEIKLSAYIQQIKRGLATKNYDFAIKRLTTTKQIIAGLTNKNNRISALQDRLVILEKELKLSFQTAKRKAKEKENNNVVNHNVEEENSVFGQKKKW